ncbi:MAG TPA: hypothetical protein VGI64_16355 [Streptosporangiaceae bacterium]
MKRERRWSDCVCGDSFRAHLFGVDVVGCRQCGCEEYRLPSLLGRLRRRMGESGDAASSPPGALDKTDAGRLPEPGRAG